MRDRKVDTAAFPNDYLLGEKEELHRLLDEGLETSRHGKSAEEVFSSIGKKYGYNSRLACET